MSEYGQFCAIARAHEALGGRWTLLVVRELLCGSRRFNDIRRGIPRISRTMLSERLQVLIAAGAIERSDGERGPEYALTEAGRELMALVSAMGTWGQRWLPRDAREEDVDVEPLLVDMQRRVRAAALPKDPIVIRFEIERRPPPRFLLLKSGEVALCTQNPGFPEPVRVRSPLAALIAWWRGDVDFATARRMGLAIDGPRLLVRAFPGWFDRYLFAHVDPAVSGRRRPAGDAAAKVNRHVSR
ncbi:MAG: winged helix-turn-helix transcriptional regulator [Alphaproteobacteria bacterium]|nr:winged helix-turn-helix transcriptional regulator [Alphaproteobacteria bacterium]